MLEILKIKHDIFYKIELAQENNARFITINVFLDMSYKLEIVR